jgi:hypothetical protein
MRHPYHKHELDASPGRGVHPLARRALAAALSAAFRFSGTEKTMDKRSDAMLTTAFASANPDVDGVRGGDCLGSVIKKRRKKMRKHKHRKLLAKTRHQRRNK